MSERDDFPCPHSGLPCERVTCPPVACSMDLDFADRIEWLEATLQRHVEAGDAMAAFIGELVARGHATTADGMAGKALWEDARRD